MAERYVCRACRKVVAATKNRRYRTHTDGDGDPCIMSSDSIPADLEPEGVDDDPGVPQEGKDFANCRGCGRDVKLTKLGCFEPHNATLRGAERCPGSGTRHRTERAVPSVDDYEPAAPEEALQLAARNLEATPMKESSPESTNTSTISDPSPAPSGPDASGPFSLGRVISELFLQPGSPFLQPVPYEGPEKPEEMSEAAKILAAKIRETFYAYDNRKSADNRSAQTTLGPSEIGTPCDRRLAMALMGVPPVNPGGDGWAAFVGTCGHDGMGEVYKFADAGTGRYAVEVPLTFRSALVPRGTSDLLDRRDATIVDWKFMGAYSLKKFKLEGPSQTYRVQAHVYALGATNAGEKVKNIAIVGLPRAGGSLDEMHVHVEPFDRKVAEAALARVDAIAAAAKIASEPMHPDGQWSAARPLEVAATFPTADDCRYCPFHLKTDKEMKRGCPGC